uniref:Histone-lysine N-methyltransferase SETMAR (inferred by orthology to a human protein) n=1 Tax=Strongyloides venezuelensis TaxID=75913 RepID=A0A0K0G3D5_STRVS
MIMNCDEKWILYDNRKRNGQWLDKNEDPKQFSKPQLTAKKELFHYEFLKHGETINSELCCQLLDKVHQKLFQKRPSLVNRMGPIFLHDNVRPHISRTTLQKLNELKYETLPHLPYSLDLASTDFHFFKQLDQFLKKKVFKNKEAIKSAFEDFIDSRDGSFSSNGINKLPLRWQHCIESNSSYFK